MTTQGGRVNALHVCQKIPSDATLSGRAIMAALPGFRRASGTSRNYIGPSGQPISRRQYDKLVAAAGLHKPVTPQHYAKQIRQQRGYNRVLQSYLRQQRGKGVTGAKGKPLGAGEARQSAEFKAIVRDIKSSTKRKKGEKQTEANAAKLRDALKRAGLRDNIPDWIPPGLSDAYKRGKITRSRQLKRYGYARGLPKAA